MRKRNGYPGNESLKDDPEKQCDEESIAELIDMWIDEVEKKKTQKFYNSLPRKIIFNEVKPLSSVKIRKTYTKKKFTM